jgi:hypothetical protein
LKHTNIKQVAEHLFKSTFKKGETMANIKITDDDIIKLIKLIALHPKSLDMLINASIKCSAILKKDHLNVDRNNLKSFFTSSGFLKQFVVGFKKIFSEDEITDLIEIYQSSVMQKVYEHSVDLFDPLYNAMMKHLTGSA